MTKKQTPHSTSSSEVKCCSASEEIPCLLQNLKLTHSEKPSTHSCHQLANPVHITQCYADRKHTDGQEILDICAMCQTDTHRHTTYQWFSLYKWRCCWPWILFQFQISYLFYFYTNNLISIIR